ncbi:MAG: DUF4293 domain-containing protein [Balneolales bacterium]|nr:DUF4293 domain-containing protein [Balneolales bacterium]
MIQRIQTVFLAFASISTLGAYFTPIYTRAMEDPQLWIGYGLAISLAIAVTGSITSIFLFRDRKNQILWVKRFALFQIIALGFCVGVIFSLGGIGTYLWDEAVGTGLVILGFIFQLLALRFINKDEKLVRSVDRIR